MNLVTIVIPIYKTKPNSFELISFTQCVNVLGKHPFTLVTHKELDITFYIDQLEHANIVNSIVYFDKSYFRDLYTYSSLLKTKTFYTLFKDFKFILIYQLDVFVFKDELNYWCKQNYDYIGAPWLKGYVDNSSTEFVGVGNGGFSLRKTNSYIKVWSYCNYFKIRKSLFELYTEFKLRNKNLNNKGKLWSLFYFIQQIIGKNNNTSYFLSKINDLEDQFWSTHIPKYFPSFNVCTPQQAINFSFEVNPAYLFTLTNEKLPFGCHAWWRHDLDFWKTHIENFGYNLSSSYKQKIE